MGIPGTSKINKVLLVHGIPSRIWRPLADGK